MTDATLAAATVVVRRLTGGRWTWPPVRAVERYPAFNQGDLVLRGRPVRRIVSVVNHRTRESLEYEAFKNGWIRLAKPHLVRSCNDKVEVEYEYGSRPSSLVAAAIDALDKEFVLAAEDDATCKLPERVTSVSRQGVSWTVIDTQEFLDKGLTGVYEVDLAISSNKARARARVFSSEYPPPERLTSTRLPDPGTNAYIIVGKGESLEIDVEYRDSNGGLINMTGGTAQLLVKQLVTGTTLYTVDSEPVGASGIIEVNVPPEVTSTWTVGDYGFVIAYTDSDGDVEWVHEGSLVVEPGGV